MRADDLRIDERELVGLALEMCNIESPPGAEREVAEFVYEWMAQEGFRPRRIGMQPDRFNVLGVLPGGGDGYSLIFNSHLDTGRSREDAWSIRDPDAQVNHAAWRDGDVLHGEGIVNDKGPLAAFLIAAKALRDAGVDLRGDLLLSAVPGEIGYEPVDEFQAPKYLSKEVGSRFLIQHGGVADYALVAEGTDFGVASIEAGKAFFKITVHGEEQLYTPFSPREEASPSHPNAIVRAACAVPALQAWACRYEERFRYEGPGGTIVPKAVIGAIRAGNPYHITRTSELCALYLDCRLVPDQDPLSIRGELRALLGEVGVPATVELFLYRRSYEAGDVRVLREGLGEAHRSVFGASVKQAEPVISSMWRDVSVFNEMGIPSITYGPPRNFRRQSMAVADLMRAAQVYALTALNVCSRVKPPATKDQVIGSLDAAPALRPASP